MGAGLSSSADTESGIGQLATWAQLKADILLAIEKDEQPDVFEDLLADVRNFMSDLSLSKQRDAI